MRWIVLLAVLATTAVAAQEASPRYSDVVLADMPDLAERLAAAGVQLDHVGRVKTAQGGGLQTVLRADEVEAVRRAGIGVDVLVDDLQASFRARPAGGCPTTPFPITGSMGCYPTLDQTVAILAQMRSMFPTLVSDAVSLGSTAQGRPVWMIEVGDQPGVDEGEPEVLITALHHAREPQGLATVLHALWTGLHAYGTDPEWTYLLNNRRVFVVPVLNPDGYVYNETTNPDGGGFWRKNRRPSGGNTFGVDLNRNYGYEWGYDDSGSSPSPGSETYRGPSAFSEPETAALRDFLEDGRRVSVALNFHSYGNLLIYPWGFEADLYTPDSAAFVNLADVLTQENGYRAGTANQTVRYLVNGSSDDWMYGEQATKPAVFAMTPEVGFSSDGFWPAPDRILPIADENVRMIRDALWFGGAALRAVGLVASDAAGGNGSLDPGETGTLQVVLRNLGRGTATGARARIVSTSSLATVSGEFSAPFTLAPDADLVLDGLSITLDPSTPLGRLDALALEVDLDGTVFTYPLPALLVGTSEVLFASDASSLDGWTATGTWGPTASPVVSPPASLTDSPAGAYLNNANTAMTLATPLDLTGATGVSLRFSAVWSIETSYDEVRVEASTNGSNWTALSGMYTGPSSGMGVQTPTGVPGYDGQQLGWVAEEMDLSAYDGAPSVWLRFRLASDGSFREDGFYVDDITVTRLVDGGTVAAESGPEGATVALGAPSPNPSQGEVRVGVSVPLGASVDLGVFDVLGRRVRTLDLSAPAAEVAWDGRDASGQRVAPGLYVLRLSSGDAVVTRRVLVIR